MNLKVSAISYRYHKNTPFPIPALDQVSFQVGPGEVVGLIGPSGAGKSCLLRLLAKGLIPDSGTITMTDPGTGRVETGLVIQEPEQQFFAATVGEEVAYALTLRGISVSEARLRAAQTLGQVGFEGDLDRSPFQLSGGQQRRVALASILVMEPELLLLDEPTVGLDRSGLAVIRKLIAEYRQTGRSAIIASHEMDFLYGLVDRFMVIHSGRLLFDFEKRQFAHYAAQLKEYQIGIPEWVTLQQRTVPDFVREYLRQMQYKPRE